MTIYGIFFIDSVKIKDIKEPWNMSQTHFVLSMLAAVCGRTSAVYTRFEAVRKMMRTVVGFALALAVSSSRWRVVRFARLPITAIPPAANPPTNNWFPLSMILKLL